MAGSGRLLGLAGRVLTALFVLSSCAGGSSLVASGATAPAGPTEGQSASVSRPTVVDTGGAPLEPADADVVRAVYQALSVADLDALSTLYAGDDWAGQAELLAQAPVRRSVLDALRAHPANLGEGYLYPGFTVNGWAGPVERADGALLGIDPAAMPDPTTEYLGYQTAFFLDYDPPHTSSGPLRWRGIALLAPDSGATRSAAAS